MNDDDGLALALDVGGTTLKAELVDPVGTVVASGQRPTPQGLRAPDAVAGLVRSLGAEWRLPVRIALSHAGEGLLDPLRVALRQRTPIVHPADVTASALGDRGGVIGTALPARDGWGPGS